MVEQALVMPTSVAYASNLAPSSLTREGGTLNCAPSADAVAPGLGCGAEVRTGFESHGWPRPHPDPPIEGEGVCLARLSER